MHVVLDLPLVMYFLNLPLVWRVIQIGYSYKAIIIFAIVVVLKELDRKNVVEARILGWQSYSIGLATNTLKHAEGANLTRG